MTTGARQLLAFRFGSDASFEGQLVGALERIESGGTVRVIDGLFVAREPESGELSAIALSDSPPSRRTVRMLGFRLDDKDRRAATQKALDGDAGKAVRSLAALLSPGRRSRRCCSSTRGRMSTRGPTRSRTRWLASAAPRSPGCCPRGRSRLRSARRAAGLIRGAGDPDRDPSRSRAETLSVFAQTKSLVSGSAGREPVTR